MGPGLCRAGGRRPPAVANVRPGTGQVGQAPTRCNCPPDGDLKPAGQRLCPPRRAVARTQSGVWSRETARPPAAQACSGAGPGHSAGPASHASQRRGERLCHTTSRKSVSGQPKVGLISAVSDQRTGILPPAAAAGVTATQCRRRRRRLGTPLQQQRLEHLQRAAGKTTGAVAAACGSTWRSQTQQHLPSDSSTTLASGLGWSLATSDRRTTSLAANDETARGWQLSSAHL
jgi:hypothetical protein